MKTLELTNGDLYFTLHNVKAYTNSLTADYLNTKMNIRAQDENTWSVEITRRNNTVHTDTYSRRQFPHVRGLAVVLATLIHFMPSISIPEIFVIAYRVEGLDNSTRLREFETDSQLEEWVNCQDHSVFEVIYVIKGKPLQLKPEKAIVTYKLTS